MLEAAQLVRENVGRMPESSRLERANDELPLSLARRPRESDLETRESTRLARENDGWMPESTQLVPENDELSAPIGAMATRARPSDA
jgi:hypothetical protein